MRFLTVVTAVALYAAFFSGCTNLTMLRTKELRAVKSSVDSLNTVLSTMQSKLLDEQKTHSEMLRLLRADQQVRFNEIDRKVSAIEGNLSENQYRLSKIDEKTAEFQKKFDAKLMADSMAGSAQIAEIEKLFQIAMSDFNAGRYDIAQSGFRDLVSQFPESKIAQDAEYWMAECSYARKAYAEAEGIYLGYIKKYPQGSKMCVSLYKLGLVYDKQNKTKSKTMLWNKLIEQCPDSEEAKVAKSRLQ
jgi:tol-pal system protein YbgF